MYIWVASQPRPRIEHPQVSKPWEDKSSKTSSIVPRIKKLLRNPLVIQWTIYILFFWCGVLVGWRLWRHWRISCGNCMGLGKVQEHI